MLTEKDYCDYETCVALKELGYKVPTSAYYMPHYKDLIWVSNPFRGGYAIDCFYSHNSLREGVVTSNYIDAPTMWEAQKWLREEKGIVVDVSFSPFGYFASAYTNVRNVESEILKERFKFEWSEKLFGEEDHDSYEGALLEGVRASIKLLKEK